MSKIKHVAIGISALSVMGMASVSLASSSCPTSISPATSACLSKAADATFQKNYQADLAKQSRGLGNAAYYSQNNNTAANYSAPKQQVQSPFYRHEQNSNQQSPFSNQNKSKNNPIHWF